MFETNFFPSPEDAEKRKARERVAQALLDQSTQIDGGTQYVNGLAVQNSPMQGLAKLGQAYAGNFLKMAPRPAVGDFPMGSVYPVA